MITTWLTKTLNINLPIIMAPMFLVSNSKMLIAASKSGIIGCIPTLNFKTSNELDDTLSHIAKETNGQYGVNLIVNKSNIHLKEHLEIAIEKKPRFIITSLGSPKEVIKQAHKNDILVFSDVVNCEYALKVQNDGADAIIAVNSGAGGHAGPLPLSILVPQLKRKCDIPIIAAGGIASGNALFSSLILGAEGVSIGTPFIATIESDVSNEYKNAIVEYGAEDIALTTKISGTPCTVIKTPFVKKIGLEQSSFEKFLNRNKQIKKYAKMLTYYKGMKLVENAALKATYKTMWCAGPSLELVNKIQTTESIINDLERELSLTIEETSKRFYQV